jgi:hypothetical protein
MLPQDFARMGLLPLGVESLNAGGQPGEAVEVLLQLGRFPQQLAEQERFP